MLKNIFTLFFLLALNSFAQASESCEFWNINGQQYVGSGGADYNTGFKSFESLGSSCQVDSGPKTVKSFDKKDLGENPTLGLMNLFKNNGYTLLSCSYTQNGDPNKNFTQGTRCFAIK